MELNFKTDENGKILDDDKIFEKIDEHIDTEKYDSAVSLILSIPRGIWSNKMRFRLICAYNNQKTFEKAEKELAEVRALCESAEDRAKYHYMYGFMCYMNDSEMMARYHYMEAGRTDPEYAQSIDLGDEIIECGEIIDGDLMKFRELSDKINDDIKKRCFQNLGKTEISDEEFQMLLGFFPGIRKIPGIERPLGFDEYFAKYEGGDILMCLNWFEKFFGIKDEESFFKYIQTDRNINLSRMVFDIAAYATGKPNFDIAELNDIAKADFENNAKFVSAFIKCLPKAGAAAWDIGEKIGFARQAFACGLISNSEYVHGMLSLSDNAKKNFANAEEYMRSLIFGAALYAFNTSQWSIAAARRFVMKMSPLLLQGDLADIKWQKYS